MYAQLIHTYRAHSGRISSIVIPKEGQTFISAAQGGELRVGNLTNDDVLFEMSHETDVIRMVPFPTGSFVAAGHADGKIIFWNSESGELVRAFDAHGDAVTALVISNDGRYIISGSADRTLAMWDTLNGNLINRSPIQPHGISEIALPPNDEYIISGEASSNGGSHLRVWSAENGDHMRDFEDSYHALRAIDFDESGNRLISSSQDGEILIWDLQTGRIEQRIETNVGVSSVTLTPNKRYALIGTHRPRLMLWSLETGELVYTFDTPSDWVSQTAISPDSRHVLAGCRDGMLNVYQLTV